MSSEKMCSNNEEMMPSHSFHSFDKRRQPRRSKIQVHRLARRRGEQNVEKDMELQNWKLYFVNRTIIEENEKLRKKANLLHQENLALMLEFQKKFPHLRHNPAVDFTCAIEG
ncbi:protein LITTLE ZIPPER 2-like isoform X2 [Syzygium oleosum]|uniref:protein LITTLE ZIPPER 2-like isoform X2 n=1 Tax=Syzygium oleosum TaxID=219896 RepID=UPI0011D254CA|nr:protein LITTLE ZIPPER 2-like isoform X2 [Syzygium oleosum]